MNNVVWITGASGGIGRNVLEKLSAQGWTVVASGRDHDSLQQLSSELDNIHILPVDVTDHIAMKDAADRIKSEFGQLDALVHSVGSILLRPLHATSVEQFQDTISLNLTSAFLAMKFSIPIMMKSGGGRIVLFSTVAAKIGMPNHSSISSAKAGIEGLAKSAAADYAKRGIRVNVVAPGLVETPLSSHLLSNENSRSISENMHPIGRVGQPQEVGSLVSWLISDGPDWMTGTVIPVDGGLGNIRSQESRRP